MMTSMTSGRRRFPIFFPFEDLTLSPLVIGQEDAHFSAVSQNHSRIQDFSPIGHWIVPRMRESLSPAPFLRNNQDLDSNLPW